MDNPFASLMEKLDEQGAQPGGLTNEQRRQRRDAIYDTYTPMVNSVLDMLITACHPEDWRKGSDVSHQYCCQITWYAGPQENHAASYDEHHDLRRVIEITLEQDEQCNPTAFKVTRHARINKSLHVGLNRDELIRGIQDVFV